MLLDYDVNYLKETINSLKFETFYILNFAQSNAQVMPGTSISIT